MHYEIRQRSFGEILDAGAQLYRNHFGLFFRIASLVVLPSALWGVMVNRWVLGGSGGPTRAAMARVGGVRFGLGAMVSSSVLLALYALGLGVLIAAIADAYLGRPLGVRQAFSRVRPLLASLLGGYVLAGLRIVLGLLLLVIPGLVWAMSYLLVTQAVVVEGKGARAALERSKKLSRGGRGRLALLGLVVGLIQVALQWGFAAVLPAAVQRLPLLALLLQQLPAILVLPLYPAVLTVAYFDLRVRKEAFDLELLAQAVEPSPAGLEPPAAGATGPA